MPRLPSASTTPSNSACASPGSALTGSSSVPSSMSRDVVSDIDRKPLALESSPSMAEALPSSPPLQGEDLGGHGFPRRRRAAPDPHPLPSPPLAGTAVSSPAASPPRSTTGNPILPPPPTP